MSYKKTVLKSVLFVVFVAFGANAQNDYLKGTIQVDKKKTIDAYILLDFTRPQNFQKEVSYMEPKDFEKYKAGGKAKKLSETVKAKEIVGFNLDNGRVFRTVKYMDMTKEGMGMMPQKLCLEQIADGTIDMYKYYSHTGSTGSVGVSKISYELADVIRESKKQGDQLLIDYIQNNFQLLAQKDHKTPKNVYSMNMLNLIGDNAKVKENYENNHYGVQQYITGDIKPGLLAHQKFELAFLTMVGDYNGNNAEAK